MPPSYGGGDIINKKGDWLCRPCLSERPSSIGENFATDDAVLLASSLPPITDSGVLSEKMRSAEWNETIIMHTDFFKYADIIVIDDYAYFLVIILTYMLSNGLDHSSVIENKELK